VDDNNENSYEALLWARRPKDVDENYGTKYSSLENIYLGCYPESSAIGPDMEHREWNFAGNDPEKCVEACRAGGYRVAGLKGAECFCSGNITRKAEAVADSTCSTNCPGDSNLKCGGPAQNSVYFVAPLRRFIGCFEVNAALKKWDNVFPASAGRTARECIEECSKYEDYTQMHYYATFAFVANNGDCTCSDQKLLSSGAVKADPKECIGRCSGPNAAPDAYCGNPGYAAGYETIATLPHRPEYPHNNANWHRPLIRRMRFNEEFGTGSIPIEDSTMTGIPLRLFTEFPEMKAILSPRLIISATDRIVAPFQAGRCGVGSSCYNPCGNIFFTEEVRKDLIDKLIIRQWYLNLKDLGNYVGENVDRVYIYAQVVVIEESYDFPFALLIRARQIIIDQRTAHMIEVNRNAPPLVDDYYDTQAFVPEPDQTFRKQTLACARLLIGRNGDGDYTTAFEMLDDVVTDMVYNQSPKGAKGELALQTAVQMGRANVTEFVRMGATYVPFLDKVNMIGEVRKMKTEFDKYVVEYTNLKNNIENTAAFLDISERLVALFVGTSITMWEEMLAYQMTEVRIAQAVYQAVYTNYTYSAEIMDQRKEEFEAALENKLNQMKREAMRGVFGAFKKVVVGIIVMNPKQIASAAQDFFAALETLEETLDYMSRCMEKVETMMARIQELTDILDGAKDGDLDELASDIELIGQIHVMYVGWENLKHHAESVLRDDEVVDQLEREAEAYLLAIWDTCNWGKKLSETMIDLAETYRKMILVRSMLEAKQKLKDDLDEWIEEARNKNNQKAINELSNHMLETQEDLRFDVNMVLQDYCDYKYYEKLSAERCVVQPQFDADLGQMQTLLQRAIDDRGFWSGDLEQAVTRVVQFRDTNTNDNCIDVTECPIKLFRETGNAFVSVPRDHPAFTNFHQFRVYELMVKLNGVQNGPSDNNEVLMLITSTGEFALRQVNTNNWHTFFSRPVFRQLVYYIGQEANPHGPAKFYCEPPAQCKSVYHRSPFAFWKLEMRSDQILDNVDMIEITFRGTYLAPAELEEEEEGYEFLQLE
jgi:hypothetical protein